MSYCSQSQGGKPEDLSCDASPTTKQSVLRTEQVISMAELIADGRKSFPNDLVPSDQQRVLLEVCQRRKDRLVQHIANLIAQDLRKG